MSIAHLLPFLGDPDKLTQRVTDRWRTDGQTTLHILHFYNSRRRLKAKSFANTEKPREHNVTWGQFVITRLIYFSSQPVHKIWRFYLQAFQRNLRGCKILKWIMWPGPRPFHWWSVVRRLTLDIGPSLQAHKIWRIFSFSRSRDIWGVWNSRMCYVALMAPT